MVLRLVSVSTYMPPPPQTFLFCLVSLLLCSCVSYQEKHVLERSKLTRPDWVEFARQNPSQALTSLSEGRYVYHRSSLRDLPLGIRQSVLQAQWSLRQHLFESFIKASYLRQSAPSATTLSAELAVKLKEASASIWAAPAPSDIYFEKVDQSRSAPNKVEFGFDIYVLIRLSSEEQEQLFQSLSDWLLQGQPA